MLQQKQPRIYEEQTPKVTLYTKENIMVEVKEEAATTTVHKTNKI